MSLGLYASRGEGTYAADVLFFVLEFAALFRVSVTLSQVRELKLAKKVIGAQWFKGTAASRFNAQDPAKASAEQVIYPRSRW